MHIPSILIAVLLFVIATALAWRDLRLGLYLIVITLPLNNRILFNLGIDRLLPVRVVIFSLVLVVLGKFYDRFCSYEQDRRKNYLSRLKLTALFYLKDPIFFILLALLLVRLISLYNSKNLAASVNLLLFYSSMVFLYVLLRTLIEKYGAIFLTNLFRLYIFMVFVSGLFSLIQIYILWRYDRILPGVWPTVSEPTRFGSTFWDINHYAPYLISAIPYFVLKGLLPESWRQGIYYWLSFSFLMLIMGLTLSRSGWLGLAVTMVIIPPILLSRRLIKETTAYLFVVQVVFLVIVLGIIRFKIPVADRLYSLTGKVHSDSVVSHALLINGNFAIFEKYPVLGAGYGSFNEHFRDTKYSAKYFEYDPVETKRLPAHSLVLEPLSETGIAGFTLYILLLFFIIKNLILAIKNAQDLDLSIKCMAILAALFGILSSGLFYSYNLEFYWVFLFLAIFIPRQVVKQTKLNRLDFTIVFALFCMATAFIFPYLSRNALIDWDESIYAEVSRNILFYKDFITLRWKRDIFWFEKPPLYFWLTSAMYYIYEVSEFAARFISALAGVFGVVVTYLLGKKLFSRSVGLVSAFTLLSTVHWIFQSRNGTLDVFVSTLVAFSMYFFYKARHQPRNWLWTGVFLGLTFMTKSVVVTVPIITMLLFAILERYFFHRKAYYPKRYLLKAVLAFLVVSLPWHLLSFYIHKKEFIDSYFLYHVVERSRGIEGHENDFYWYFIVLKVWMRHNFIILVPAFLYLSFRVYRIIRNKKDSALGMAEAFLVIWGIVTFTIFSLSTSKIQWYIMPIYPVVSIMIGRFLSVLFKGRLNYLLVLITAFSVPLAYSQYRPLWDIEDLNRDIAETARYMKVLTGDDRDVTVLAVNLAPGPIMFYSERPVVTVTREGMLSYVTSKEPFYALGKMGDIDKIQEEIPDQVVAIFKQSGDYILYGRR